MTSPSIDGTIASYGAAWNEPDDAARREMLARAWADAGTYTDPTAHVEGREALARHIADFQARTPGARILLSSGVDAHHGVLRFTWRMVRPDGAVALEGTDFGELDDDGRLRRIVGFFGPVPQG